MTRILATSYHGRHRRDQSDWRDAAAGRPGASRPALAPAYYLGRPASLWLAVMNPRASMPQPVLTPA
ncbi:MAG: hypothetical protein J2P35_22490 [Actinobacteria bacterium]|nr:hypothetical protein [Actinomycetota bacterium]MBO0787779.1 hypothetical protein [Actinomycetota bacterium]MBO0788776.1 hypothetical protein [Actinomycetota bacterium]